MNEIIKSALMDFFRATAEARFKLPIRFTLHNGAGQLLREFRIHRDGLELGVKTGRRPAYVFPLVAVAKSADGRTATVRLAEAETGKIQFLNKTS